MNKLLKIQVLASGSSGNAYTVTDGKTRIMLDCGIPIKQIQAATKYQAGRTDACLVTHEHQDHIKAAKDLARLGVDIYATEGTFSVSGLKGHRIKPIEKLEQFEVGTFQIMPFDVIHDAADPVGYLIKSTDTGARLLYVTDTHYIRYKFDEINYLMIECNYITEQLQRNIRAAAIHSTYSKRIYSSHMSLETVVDFINNLENPKAIKEVYLLHLSDRNSDEQLMKETIQRATGAVVHVC